MGNGVPYHKIKLELIGLLRMAKQRIVLLKDKRLQQISKKTKEIQVYLENGNEDNAKIWAQTLINDENYVSAIDVIKLYLDQMLGRLDLMKDGPLPDMDQAVGTIIFAQPYCGVKEIDKIRGYLIAMLKKQKRDVEAMKKIKNQDPEFCNELVVRKLRIYKPEEGLIYKKLEEIAEKLNIPWEKSEYAKRIIALWIDRVLGVDEMPPPPSHFPSGPPPPPSGGYGGGGGGVVSYPMPSMAPPSAPIYPSAPMGAPLQFPPYTQAPGPPKPVAYPGEPRSKSVFEPVYDGRSSSEASKDSGSLTHNPSSSVYPPTKPSVPPPPPVASKMGSDLDDLEARLKNLKD